MIRFVAIVNIPGYLPMDDEPPVFDTAQEAWAFLADERRRGEDDTEGEEYTNTVAALDYIASGEHVHGNPHEGWPTNADGTGTVYGSTPGSDSPHDLGLAYSVTAVGRPGNPILAEVRLDDYRYDPFGTYLSWAFAVAAVMTHEGIPVPSQWEYRPPMGGGLELESTDGIVFALYRDGVATDDDLRIAGEVLTRLVDLCHAAGRSY